MGDNLNGIFANMIQGMGFIGCAPNRVYNMAPPDGGGVEATAEGTELTLHSAAAPLTALALYGKSEQEKTTGAQLANFPDVQGVENNGVTWSCKNGIIHATGATADDKYSVFNDGEYIIPVVAGTYYVSSNSYDADVYVSVLKNETTQYYKNSTFTLDGTETQCKIYAQVSPGKTVDETIYAMLNAGDTALPWEPYTGGAPSPSPDYPQEIKSVGDSGTINVSLSDGGSQSQTFPVQTPNGLPGIPVSSGGNYTDANGQQWICDEVDFKRGVYVQRVKKTSSITWRLHAGYTVEDSELFSAGNIKDGIQESSQYNQSFCSKLIRDNSVLNKNKSGFYQSYGSFFARIKGVSELDEFNLLMADAEFLYRLETPIETPLSVSELAAYAALRTYSPTTVVSNDAGAWMKVGYKATPQPMTMLARKR